MLGRRAEQRLERREPELAGDGAADRLAVSTRVRSTTWAPSSKSPPIGRRRQGQAVLPIPAGPMTVTSRPFGQPVDHLGELACRPISSMSAPSARRPWPARLTA